MDRERITDVSQLSGVSELTDALAEETNFCTRRQHGRVFCAEQNVRLSIRLRGELRSHRAELLDINAFGLALTLTRPLRAERTAFLTFSWHGHKIKDVVATISNCLQTSKTNALLTGYRCGLSFRPSSPLQLDRQETAKKIDALVEALGAAQYPDLSPSNSALLPQGQPAA